jgi:3'-phosphoadenosine 5'-phosphosulfate sulfotransferase (PAPS reductase)/FAD synthetase
VLPLQQGGVVVTAVSTAPEIEALIAAGAPVAIGVSGGSDSQAAALATFAYLDRQGHSGPRVLVHADLGIVEWNASLPVCETLAAHLGAELIVVRRKAGGLMERWEARWQSSLRRYINLETVCLVLPWSTPGMRFCTSELKTHPIRAELRRRFKKCVFINVTGVRRAESAARAKSTIAAFDHAGNADWRLIAEWQDAEVFEFIAENGLEPHEAYTDFGMSRVSCKFCIMSSEADLIAASSVPESQDLLCRMVDLEIASTFAFQGNRWLGDIAPQLLGFRRAEEFQAAKVRALARIAVEAKVTKAMRYVSGWPTRMLTDDEAGTLANVRRAIGGLFSIEPLYLDVPSIHSRYAELMETKRLREAA